MPENGAQRTNFALQLLPGTALSCVLAIVAVQLHSLPTLRLISPIIISIVIGMLVSQFVRLPRAMEIGIKFSSQTVLRVAIVLLGFQLTATQLLSVGWRGLAVVAATLIASFFFMIWLGRRMGVDTKLATLLAVGTSVCGASAIVAANTVTQSKQEDVAYAVACVTLFGCVSMFGLPLLVNVFSLSQYTYGIWAGSAVHEVAQATAASFQVGQIAGETGTIAKLARVLMLAPLVLLLGNVTARCATEATVSARKSIQPIPWFVAGFVLAVAVNSFVHLSIEAHELLTVACTFLMCVALTAVGLKTDIRKVWAKGWMPFFLGAAGSAFIAAFSLLLIHTIL